MQTVDAQAQEIAKKENLALWTFYCYEILFYILVRLFDCSIQWHTFLMLGFLIGIVGIPAAPEEEPDVVEIPVVETLVAPRNIIKSQFKISFGWCEAYNLTNWNFII